MNIQDLKTTLYKLANLLREPNNLNNNDDCVVDLNISELLSINNQNSSILVNNPLVSSLVNFVSIN